MNVVKKLIRMSRRMLFGEELKMTNNSARNNTQKHINQKNRVKTIFLFLHLWM